MGFIINKRMLSLACLSIISAWAVTCVPQVMEHGACYYQFSDDAPKGLFQHCTSWLFLAWLLFVLVYSTSLQLLLPGVAAALLMAIRNVRTNVADELRSTN